MFPTAVGAQTPGRIDIAGGYAWLHDQEGEVTFSRGWFASLGADLVGPLGIVGQVSGSSKGQTGIDVEFSMGIVSIMGGPRVAFRTQRVTPFAQLLFGSTRFTSTYELPTTTLRDSNSVFGIELGGGADIQLVPHVAARFGVHRRRLHTETYTPTGTLPFTSHQTEGFAGVVVR